jgi:hypothetical protein
VVGRQVDDAVHSGAFADSCSAGLVEERLRELGSSQECCFDFGFPRVRRGASSSLVRGLGFGNFGGPGASLPFSELSSCRSSSCQLEELPEGVSTMMFMFQPIMRRGNHPRRYSRSGAEVSPGSHGRGNAHRVFSLCGGRGGESWSPVSLRSLSTCGSPARVLSLVTGPARVRPWPGSRSLAGSPVEREVSFSVGPPVHVRMRLRGLRARASR